MVAGNVHDQFVDGRPIFGLECINEADAIDLDGPPKRLLVGRSYPVPQSTLAVK
jgi:hypothetical protein